MSAAAPETSWPAIVRQTWQDDQGQWWRKRDDGTEEPFDPVTENDPPPRRLTFQSVQDLCAEVDAMGPPRWLFRGAWPADAYGVLAAEDKAGKSWAIVDAAVAVATGRPWLSVFPCDAPGAVLVFVGEGGKRNTVRRLRAVAEAHQVTTEKLPITVVDRVPHLSSPDQLAEVTEHLSTIPTRLVILDPLYLAARGASGSDLYAMGEALEGLQHVCQAAGAALLVVTHFRKQGTDNPRRGGTAARTSARITGVGPSAWGRVLVTGAVESRYTDPDSKLSRVVIGWEIVGGEVPDQTFRTSREVWADDPDDLASPLHVTWTVAEPDPDEPTGPKRAELADAKPAARRVHAVLERADRPLTVKDIGDRIAAGGHALKARTIQDALNTLSDLRAADSIAIDGRGTCQWWLTGADHAPAVEPAPPVPDEPPPDPLDEPDPWTEEHLT